MTRILMLPLAFILFFFTSPGTDTSTASKEAIACVPGNTYTLAGLPRIKHPRLVYPDEQSDSPRAVANNNTLPAGKLSGNTLELSLEAGWSDFYFETNDRPGLHLITIAEKGKAPVRSRTADPGEDRNPHSPNPAQFPG